jgi:hypothetical protein
MSQFYAKAEDEQRWFAILDKTAAGYGDGSDD